MRGGRIWAIGGFVAGAVLIAVRRGRALPGRDLVPARPRRAGATRRSSAARTCRRRRSGRHRGGRARGCRGARLRRRRRGDRHRRGGALLRLVHAHPRARGDRRPDLRGDGPLPVGRRSRRPGRNQRRGRGGQGRAGQPDLQRPAEPLDQRDRARDRAQRLLHGRADRDLRDRRRDRAPHHRDRAARARLRRVRTRRKEEPAPAT